MINGDSCEGDESYSKWKGEFIVCQEEAKHHKWQRHNHRVEDDKRLREAMKLECENRKYYDESDKES